MRSTRSSARPRARGMGLVPYLLLVGMVVWLGILGAALLWGGGSDGPANGGQSDGGAEAGSVAAGAREPGEGGAREPEEGGASPDASGEAAPAEPASRETPEEEDYAEVDHVGGENPDRKSSGTRLPRGSSGDGEAPYDPLGTGVDAATLSETDLSRARLAAFRYVDAAYDFEGSGPSARLEYLEEVNRTVDAPEFWESPDSPGSDPAELVAKKTAEYGVDNAALFRDFAVEETSSERVIGTVTFAFDEGGGEKTYEQRLVLSRWAAVWRVLHAKPLAEASS